MDNQIGDRVGVPFVRVALTAYAAVELDTCALLHDVRRFVGGEMQRGRRFAESDVVPHREAVGTHGGVGFRGVVVGVSLDTTDIVAAKRPLDGGKVRKGLRRATYARVCRVLDALFIVGSRLSSALNGCGRCEQGFLFGEIR